MNSLAVLAAVMALGADVDRAPPRRSAQLQALKGRGQRRTRRRSRGGSFELIDDSYNASPASMRAALQVLGADEPARGGRRIAVLGDMRELGAAGADAASPTWRRPLPRPGSTSSSCCGPLMAPLYDGAAGGRCAAPIAPTRRSLCAAVLRRASRAGDVVLVKGSLGSRMAPIVEALQALDAGGACRRAVNGH